MRNGLFVGNNPINGVDPTGHFTLVEGGAAVVVAAITVAVIGTYLLLHPPKFQMPISSGGTCPVNLPTQTQTPVTPQLPQQEPFPWDPTYNPYEPLIFPDSSDWNIPYRNDAAKAPGKPTADDGYVPAKNWDGEKVRNPNGAGAGYPDENGHVWVPTGEGPLAHGGPHWDVQNPNGGYRNVYPGGKVR
jgi:hypothetical protein